jgi:hypothetical protein
MTVRKFIGVPFSLVALTVPTSIAGAQTIVGDSGQTNAQSGTTTQGVSQNGGSGGVVVGSPTQTAQNQSDTSLNNSQAIGEPDDSVIVGGSGQTNTQNSATTQGITQGGAANVTVGSPTQTAQNQASTTLNSFMVIGDDTGVIVGGSGQKNAQNQTTGQTLGQNAGGGVVVGDPTQSGQNQSSATFNNCAIIGAGTGECDVR